MTTETVNTRKGRRAADWLCLAAAPSFAIMALLSGMSSADLHGICGAMQSSSPLSGMTGMYLLMSAFHSAPWLNLLTATRRRVWGRLAEVAARPAAGGAGHVAASCQILFRTRR